MERYGVTVQFQADFNNFDDAHYTASLIVDQITSIRIAGERVERSAITAEVEEITNPEGWVA